MIIAKIEYTNKTYIIPKIQSWELTGDYLS